MANAWLLGTQTTSEWAPKRAMATTWLPARRSSTPSPTLSITPAAS
jgi:hypothetical protein